MNAINVYVYKKVFSLIFKFAKHLDLIFVNKFVMYKEILLMRTLPFSIYIVLIFIKYLLAVFNSNN